MQITYGPEEFDDRPEETVDIDLLKVGLGEPFLVVLVVFVGTIQESSVPLKHHFPADQGRALFVLVESQFVDPRAIWGADLNPNLYIGVAACRQATDSPNPAPAAEGLLEPSSR